MHRLRRILVLGILAGFFSLLVEGCALLVVGAAGGAAAGTAVSVKDSRDTHHSPLTYVGTVVANVVYVPVKAVFAGGGAVTSGVSYVVTLGRPEPTDTIWNTTVGGDYVMTPDMIEGREPIHFAGASKPSTSGAVSRRGTEGSGAQRSS